MTNSNKKNVAEERYRMRLHEKKKLFSLENNINRVK